MILRRHLWLALGMFALVVGGAAAWTAWQVPTYSAGASVLVAPKSESVVDIQAVSPT